MSRRGEAGTAEIAADGAPSAMIKDEGRRPAVLGDQFHNPAAIRQPVKITDRAPFGLVLGFLLVLASGTPVQGDRRRRLRKICSHIFIPYEK
jgi:hypothetical protein